MDWNPVGGGPLPAGSDPALLLLNSGDIAWMLASSALVMIMTPGVSFFYVSGEQLAHTRCTGTVLYIPADTLSAPVCREGWSRTRM